MGGRRRRRRGGRRRSSIPSPGAEHKDADESCAEIPVQGANRSPGDSAVVEHDGNFFFRTYGTWRPHPWIDPGHKIRVLFAIMYPQHPWDENEASSEIPEVLSPGDFMKTIVRHGDGCYLPEKGVGAEVHLTATSSDGCQLASTRHGDPLIIVLGDGEDREEYYDDDEEYDDDDDKDQEEEEEDNDVDGKDQEEEEEDNDVDGKDQEEEEEDNDVDGKDQEEEEEEEDTINKDETAALLKTAIGTMRIRERGLFTIAFSSLCDNETITSDTAPSVETVQYDIELLSTIQDLHGDGGIIMKLTFGGCDWSLSSWDCQPRESDYVTVKYEARLTDGTIISKSDGIEFAIKDGHLCPAISTAVLFLTEGQKATLTVKPQYAFGDEGRPGKADDGEVPPNATIEVDLELLFISFVFHIGDDETIQVRKLRRGHDKKIECAGEDSLVQVRLIGKLQDGTVFMNKGRNGTEVYEIMTSQDQVVDGLDEAITMMNEGEVYLVTVPPKHAFGSEGSQQQLAFVPPNATVTFEVELVSIISKRKKHYFDMETKECIDTAWKKKKEGDALITSKQYKQASKRYDKAVEMISQQLPYHYRYTIEEIEARRAQEPISDIEPDAGWDDFNYEDANTDRRDEPQIEYDSASYYSGEDFDPKEKAKYKKLRRLIVPSNLLNAECQIELENYKKAAQLCTEVLILASNHTKAQRIRSQAYSRLSDNRLTELDIMSTLEDLGLKYAPENDLGRRLWLLQRYRHYRLYGSKSLMGGRCG